MREKGWTNTSRRSERIVIVDRRVSAANVVMRKSASQLEHLRPSTSQCTSSTMKGRADEVWDEQGLDGRLH